MIGHDLEHYLKNGHFSQIVQILLTNYDPSKAEAPRYEAALDISRFWLKYEPDIANVEDPLPLWDNFLSSIFQKHQKIAPTLLFAASSYIMRKIHTQLTRHAITPHDKSPFSSKLGLARCLIWMEQPEQASSFLKELIRHYPRQSAPWALMGKIYFERQDYKKSLLCYREAFFINPSVLNLMDINSKIVDQVCDFYTQHFGSNEYIPDYKAHLQWIGISGLAGNFFQVRRELDAKELQELDQRIEVYENKYNLYHKRLDFLNLIRLYAFKIDYYLANNAKNKVSSTMRKLEVIEPAVYKKFKITRG